MPTGRPKCPVCQGTGELSEDTHEYEFVTRDPITSKCLVCNGTGILNRATKMPNGQRAFEVFPKADRRESKRRFITGNRLNVSRKAAINPEVVDTGLGYQPGVDKMDKMDKMDGMDKPGVESQKEAYENPMFLEMALNPRLNKVLASGKEFLIVTETEPYYLDVYRMIRHQEQTQGTWTRHDEQGYVEALEDRIKELDSRLSTPAANKLSAGDPGRGNDKKEAING